jgi:hypothetical protein
VLFTQGIGDIPTSFGINIVIPAKGGNPVNSLPGADLAMKVTSPGIALLLTSFCGNDVVMGMMLLRK